MIKQTLKELLNDWKNLSEVRKHNIIFQIFWVGIHLIATNGNGILTYAVFAFYFVNTVYVDMLLKAFEKYLSPGDCERMVLMHTIGGPIILVNDLLRDHFLGKKVILGIHEKEHLKTVVHRLAFLPTVGTKVPYNSKMYRCTSEPNLIQYSTPLIFLEEIDRSKID